MNYYVVSMEDDATKDDVFECLFNDFALGTVTIISENELPPKYHFKPED